MEFRFMYMKKKIKERVSPSFSTSRKRSAKALSILDWGCFANRILKSWIVWSVTLCERLVTFLSKNW